MSGFAGLRWKRAVWLLPALLLCGCGGQSPPYSYDLFCTWSRIYRVDAQIEVAGRRYRGWAVKQESRSRDWIYNLNSNGCPSQRGDAIIFRLADGRAVLLRSGIPASALPRYDEQGNVGVDDFVAGRSSATGGAPDGYIIESADRPARWIGFWLGDGPVRLVGLRVEPRREPPDDEIDRLAPALLGTEYESGEGWAANPSAMIAYSRRPEAGIRFHAFPAGPAPERRR